ncbi:MAG: hypothetical protein HGB14_09655, partial [Anaerolineaceae bacterium]|nr:hypothetical protein [Anaerolineaceae bacterium]
MRAEGSTLLARARDERAIAELQGMWTSLQLTGDAAKAKQDATIANYTALKQHEYTTYWKYRDSVTPAMSSSSQLTLA